MTTTTGLQNATHPYWTPESVYNWGQKSQHTYDGYGFTFKLPWRDPVTCGWYFGEGPVPQRQEMIYRSDPEYYAIYNTVPSSGGLPKYNLYDPAFTFNRSKYVQKV